MQEENTPKKEEKIDTDEMHISHHMVRFFDLLAKFDYEDKKKNEQALGVAVSSRAAPHDTCQEVGKAKSDDPPF